MPSRTTVSRSVSNDLDRLDVIVDEEDKYSRQKSSEEMKKSSSHASGRNEANEKAQGSSSDSIYNVISGSVKP